MIYLSSAAKANARLNGRDTVTIQDVREMAPFVLRHRLIMKQGHSPDTALLDALSTVPTPVAPAPLELA